MRCGFSGGETFSSFEEKRCFHLDRVGWGEQSANAQRVVYQGNLERRHKYRAAQPVPREAVALGVRYSYPHFGDANH